MDSSPVFRTISRINSVLLLVGLIALGVMALVAATSSMDWSRRVHRAQPAAVMPATGEKLFFGSVEAVDGSPFVLLPLESRRPGMKLSSGSSHTGHTRNLLFYDAASGEARWLRSDHRAVVFSHELLRESGAVLARWESRKPGASTSDPVRWIRYDLALSDTNGDAVIDESDARQVAVSGPDGKDLAVVLDRVDEVLGYTVPESGKLVVFFRRGEGEFAGEISLTARKLVRTVPLPKS